MLSTLMPPSTSSRMSRPLASMSLRAARLAQRAVDEALAAEAGVDAHDQHQVDLVDHPLQHVQRRGRVEHQAGLAALGLDQLQRAVDVRAGVGVEADQVGAGLGRRPGQRIDRLHHQVHVDRHRCRVLAQRLADHRAEGQVGHVMVVHHVEVDPVGAGGDDVAHLLAQAGESRPTGWLGRCGRWRRMRTPEGIPEPRCLECAR
jgi:hypothetical protein